MTRGHTLPTIFLLALSVTSATAEDIAGFTEPFRDLDLAAADTGRIDSVAVKDGEIVRKSQILATINQDILKASRRITEAQLNAKGRINSASADLRLKTERVQKLQDLLRRNHAAQEEVDRASIEREVAAAALETVREEQAIRALERDRIDVQIERQFVRSPIDGTVVRTFKDVGEFVSPADAVVVRVVQLNPLRAVFNVPVRSVGNELIDGSVADVTVHGMPAKATVENVSPIVEPQSGTVRVKILIDNSDGILRAGEACTLKVASPVDRMASSEK